MCYGGDGNSVEFVVRGEKKNEKRYLAAGNG